MNKLAREGLQYIKLCLPLSVLAMSYRGCIYSITISDPTASRAVPRLLLICQRTGSVGGSNCVEVVDDVGFGELGIEGFSKIVEDDPCD